MTEVLVAGGAGYIGTHTCVELLNKGYDVVCLDNYSNSSPTALDRVGAITGRQIKAYEGDVRDRETVRKVLGENEISGVLHLAGLKSVSESVRRPLAYYDNNIYGALVLLEEMDLLGIKNFLFSSSATVYGEPSNLPLTEAAQSNRATNPYGKSKEFEEQILSDLVTSDPEWSIVILRYFNPIGAHSSGLIGEDPADIPANLNPYILKVISGEIERLTVFGNDYPTKDGTGVRDFIHVVDLAKGHVSAIDAGLGQGLHTFNLGTGSGCSVLDLVQEYQRVVGREIPIEFGDRRDGDVAVSFASAEKAEAELEWKADLSLNEMVKSSLEWYSKNPRGYRQ